MTGGTGKQARAQIDGPQFARTGGELNGRVPGGRLTRLVELGCRTEGLDYRLEGGLNQRGKPALWLEIAGQGEMACQRCLEPLAVNLSVSTELELASSIEAIERAEDDIDRVLAGPAMDVAGMVEDEAMLLLPMVPAHDLCATVEIAAAEEPQESPEGKTESPFAALAALRQSKRREN
ncbi:MAG TPA: DUF177 domain-containing protein [Burkholderiales bacterium]|nr:DUF177 domain-containing protein [Burkholderiales bacterium]